MVRFQGSRLLNKIALKSARAPSAPPGLPRGSPGLPRGSPGALLELPRSSPGAPPELPGAPPGLPRGSPGAPPGLPRGSPGALKSELPLEWREHRTYRCYCGSTPVHIRSPKSSPAMRISLFSNLHEGDRLVSLKYNVNIYGGDRFEEIHTPQRDRLFH